MASYRDLVRLRIIADTEFFPNGKSFRSECVGDCNDLPMFREYNNGNPRKINLSEAEKARVILTSKYRKMIVEEVSKLSYQVELYLQNPKQRKVVEVQVKKINDMRRALGRMRQYISAQWWLDFKSYESLFWSELQKGYLS